ncbi:uncharacterized protein KY384_007911 [Bacidia gigantensis]|uniref:uncharacterized protein n=1 Tax=Bacidia gigantensis TaxID=2732470 RepID=UPI001D054B06|nr:uncharacterized protein KY384_007911 [Bacidia gigantensis]KAG8527757.1 hypothetical protein KY384_007911 [Bacidia gigantensis]
MGTQYDHIGSTYSGMKLLPAGMLEAYNLRKNCTSIQDAKVLDLACGTGHYSRLGLRWGASRVHGVDISPVMVDTARDATMSQVATGSRLKVTYSVADCTRPKKHAGSPFDIVLGSWILNYAASQSQMTHIFRTAYMNLRPGGHFVCIVPHPSEQPRKTMEKALEVRSSGKQGEHWITMTPTKDVEGGVGTRIDAMTKTGFVTFEAFHLRRSIFEQAAKGGGFTSGVMWRRVTLPENEGWEQDWRASFIETPHFGVLVVRKDEEVMSEGVGRAEQLMKAIERGIESLTSMKLNMPSASVANAGSLRATTIDNVDDLGIVCEVEQALYDYIRQQISGTPKDYNGSITIVPKKNQEYGPDNANDDSGFDEPSNFESPTQNDQQGLTLTIEPPNQQQEEWEPTWDRGQEQCGRLHRIDGSMIKEEEQREANLVVELNGWDFNHLYNVIAAGLCPKKPKQQPQATKGKGS